HGVALLSFLPSLRTGWVSREDFMKRMVSETQRTTQLFRRRLSLRAFLRRIGFSSLILFLLCIFSIISSSASVFRQPLVVHAVTRQVAAISTYADIAIV